MPYARWRPGRDETTTTGIPVLVKLGGLGMLAAIPLLASPATWSIGVFAFVALAAIGLVAMIRWRRRDDDLEDRVELRDATFVALVRVQFRWLWFEYGSDSGALNVDGPYVHFHGRRCEFSLTSRLANPQTAIGSGVDAVLPDGFSVGFRPIEGRLTRSVVDAVGAALSIQDPVKMAPVWPPIEPSSPVRVVWLAVATSFAGLATALVVKIVWELQAPVRDITFALILICAFATGPAFALFYVATVRRLKRYLERPSRRDGPPKIE